LYDGYGFEIVPVVRAVVRLVGHLMLILVRYEKGKLIYTHCHVITSHKLGRCVVQTATTLLKQQPRCLNSNGVVAYEEVTSQQFPFGSALLQEFVQPIFPLVVTAALHFNIR